MPDLPPDKGRILVANGHGGTVTSAGLVYADEDGDGAQSLGVLGDVEAHSFRVVRWLGDTPVVSDAGSVAATWAVSGTATAGLLSYLTDAGTGGVRVSASFPYPPDWLAQGWKPSVQATIEYLPTVNGVPFARAAGGVVEIGVRFPSFSPVSALEAGAINYLVTLVAV